MEKLLNIYKPIGVTPYQLIQQFRKELPEYQNVKIGFAGRLDPLAQGVLLLMIGDETKKRDKYLTLPKEYEFQILFGIETDTYDALGLLQNNKPKQAPDDLEKQIRDFIKFKLGKNIQRYPPYSSKAVDGKPLYWWARNDKLSVIKIPEREIEIYNFELLGLEEIPADKIKGKIIRNIKSVNGDFRQAETLKKWNTLFNINGLNSFTVAKFRISCSSGTYVRSLAHELGKEIDSGAIALEILRTMVGEYALENSVQLTS